MKKIVSIFIILLLFVTGCGKKNGKDVLKEFNKKINSLDSYYLEGKMEIINNEDIYKYDVAVSFKDKDLYKVSLKNESNEHEQIILKNAEGVYVLTPSLNKSFKFESEWPYSNSQVYLPKSILQDMNNDKSLEFVKDENGYMFTSAVNYPNNRTLIKQKIYLNNNLDLDKVEVLNENNNIEINMKFNKFEKNPKFDDEYFTLKKNIEVSNTSEKVESVSKIEEAIFPMYVPENTSLTSQDVITKDKGERLILTFGGEKPFVLIEETVDKKDELEIIPTLGEPTILMDTIGFVSDDSISFISKGIEYYIASEKLTKDELLEVAKSISTIPVMK